MIPPGSSTVGSAWFLDGLANLQARQTETQRQLSSGYRVRDAADAPGEVPELVSLGTSLAAAQTYQSTLGKVQAEAQLADSVLGNSISLVARARSLAAQGANTITTAAERLTLAAEIQGIQEQLVAGANATSGGRYIFGGDEDQTAPYTANAASSAGVDSHSSPAATRVIVNPIGQTIYQGLSATSVFNPADSAGLPVAGNTFVALQNLRVALLANDAAGTVAALDQLKVASDYLIRQQAYYGAAEQRITGEQGDVANQVTAFKVQIGRIRDADIVEAATDLTLENTSLQAALGAQASVSRKSLFDYLG